MKNFLIKLNTIEDVQRFVEAATTCKFDIDIVKDRYIIDAKSYLGILSISLATPLEVNAYTENDDPQLDIFVMNCKQWIV